MKVTCQMVGLSTLSRFLCSDALHSPDRECIARLGYSTSQQDFPVARPGITENVSHGAQGSIIPIDHITKIIYFIYLFFFKLWTLIVFNFFSQSLANPQNNQCDVTISYEQVMAETF